MSNGPQWFLISYATATTLIIICLILYILYIKCGRRDSKKQATKEEEDSLRLEVPQFSSVLSTTPVDLNQEIQPLNRTEGTDYDVLHPVESTMTPPIRPERQVLVEAAKTEPGLVLDRRVAYSVEPRTRFSNNELFSQRLPRSDYATIIGNVATVLTEIHQSSAPSPTSNIYDTFLNMIVQKIIEKDSSFPFGDRDVHYEQIDYTAISQGHATGSLFDVDDIYATFINRYETYPIFKSTPDLGKIHNRRKLNQTKSLDCDREQKLSTFPPKERSHSSSERL